MQITPAVNVTRFAQLKSGELFIFRVHGDGHVGFVATDPTQNDEKLLLLLGPKFPAGMKHPALMHLPRTTAVSFGSKFTVHLPALVDGWLDNEPPPDRPCILLTDGKTYFRANFRSEPDNFQACYVDISNGKIFTTGSAFSDTFATPPGIHAFAVQWEIVTDEGKPRSILAYPQPK